MTAALLTVLAWSVSPRALGRWSNPHTWQGHSPGLGQDVTVPAGTTVLLDQSPPPLGDITVNGTLIFADTDLALTCRSLTIQGRLQIGTSLRPFQRQAIITLTGQAGDGGSVKTLAIMKGGVLELHGQNASPAWTRLGQTAAAGTRRLKLTQSVSWTCGQHLVVASTDFDPGQAEMRTIQAVHGTSVLLDRPLLFLHYGADADGVNEQAEVGLLSHNVIVQGDASSVADGFGGQVMIMRGGAGRLSGTEFRWLGQQGQIGRYPVHFHLAGEQAGSYIRGCSIHDCFNRFLTLHGTQHVRVINNIGYNTIGHGFFLEDGTETGNVLDGNLGLLTRRPQPGHAVLASDTTPATFWITNPANILRGNVAAGSEGHGFWYDLPIHPTGANDTPASRAAVQPRRTPLGLFDGNTAHSNAQDGLFVDGPPNPPGVVGAPSYTPCTRPAIFMGLTAYKNRRRGFWLRGQGLVVRAARLADNGIGGTFAAADAHFCDSLVVGQTANTGTPAQGEWPGEGRRSLPRPWLPGAPLIGFEFYDGPVTVERVRFHSFLPDAQRPAGALGVLERDPFFLHPDNIARSLHFSNAQPVYFASRFFSGHTAPGDPDAGADGARSAAFWDADGSVSGGAGSEIILDTPFLRASITSRHPAWNAAVSRADYAHLFLDNQDAHPMEAVPVCLTRQDSTRPSMNLWGIPKIGPNTSFQTTVITGHSYAVRWHGLAPRHLRVTLRAAPKTGDWIILILPFPRGQVVVGDVKSCLHLLPQVQDLSSLRNSAATCFCHRAGLLVLKLTIPPGPQESAVADISIR